MEVSCTTAMRKQTFLQTDRQTDTKDRKANSQIVRQNIKQIDRKDGKQNRHVSRQTNRQTEELNEVNACT